MTSKINEFYSFFPPKLTLKLSLIDQKKWPRNVIIDYLTNSSIARPKNGTRMRGLNLDTSQRTEKVVHIFMLGLGCFASCCFAFRPTQCLLQSVCHPCLGVCGRVRVYVCTVRKQGESLRHLSLPPSHSYHKPRALGQRIGCKCHTHKKKKKKNATK